LERHRRKLTFAQFLVVFGLGLVVASFIWGERSTESNNVEPSAGVGEGSEEGPTMWTCSMHPQIRKTEPGKCPICSMDLIPVAKTSGGLRSLTVSPESRALMEVQTSPVERRYVTHTIPMVGKVGYNESNLGYITAWVSGRLDRLYADYSGMEVKKGDHMASIYSEELYTTQEELIQALKYAAERRTETPLVRSRIDLVQSAREKLRNLGLAETQIQEIEQRGTPEHHITIHTPVGGIVIEKLKQEGERVSLGDRIYTIADLREVWVHLDAYEADLSWIRYGQDVTITTEAYPGEQFKGRISFIQPVLNDRTRTVKVRVNAPNGDGKLKPDMFVHAVVRPRVAAGGRVMDPSLIGKWISPMHPEIVKDEPGTCDVCGMPLVRAETLGYVAPETDEQAPPLIIPYSAALVTGTRAVVYVQLPSMHSAAEPAFQTLSAVIQEGKLEKTRQAFATFGAMLDRPYDQPGTDFARSRWNKYADRLAQHAMAGQRAASAKDVEQIFSDLERTMDELRETFAPPGQPTFEGREIVLGPRAGEYYLVRRGLDAGEMVVTQGNFKIDAEIQLQAKPSMMTPEGGGEDHSGHAMSLPADFLEQVRVLESAYDELTQAVQQADHSGVTAGFEAFGEALEAVDSQSLTGYPRTFWKEIAMLLGNDAAEGQALSDNSEVDRVFLLLKGRMRRMREQLGISHEPEREVERLIVGAEFQAELARLWQAYLPMHDALANDDLDSAKEAIGALASAVGTANDVTLTGRVKQVWQKEQTNLSKIVLQLQAAQDLDAIREAFSPLSEETAVLVKAFGFGDVGPVYLLHCPMAFQNRGAIWLQNQDQARNPYYGSTMLRCADRVEQIPVDQPGKDRQHGEQTTDPHAGHTHQ
jgi:multidrug resistance efflux pump